MYSIIPNWADRASDWSWTWVGLMGNSPYAAVKQTKEVIYAELLDTKSNLPIL
jgi:hypothetical protein